MTLLLQLFDFFVHLNKYLPDILNHYGDLSYILLFLVIFCETGLVVTPFLPGDSLLFMIGALSASGALKPQLIVIILMAASILGDTTNYHIGKAIGKKTSDMGKIKFLNKEHLDKTHAFYERHGSKVVVIAKFMPIIRTFSPFVAGLGAMTFKRFLLFNIIGGTLWVNIFIWLGYYFGNLDVVKNNFFLVLVGIVLLSLSPGGITYLLEKSRSRKEKKLALEKNETK